ncbi:hypothetical protein CEXT_116441 [Caerostris extrusa]|uniref:Uncharacterized protein n=1 Tax=Caerostris extrusa TaxID=172846 RepID=A0AAV4VDR7_CAEEX|nr:hypothetical protein CEXT_116441 [Caerostris extrusa]
MDWLIFPPRAMSWRLTMMEHASTIIMRQRVSRVVTRQDARDFNPLENEVWRAFSSACSFEKGMTTQRTISHSKEEQGIECLLWGGPHSIPCEVLLGPDKIVHNQRVYFSFGEDFDSSTAFRIICVAARKTLRKVENWSRAIWKSGEIGIIMQLIDGSLLQIFQNALEFDKNNKKVMEFVSKTSRHEDFTFFLLDRQGGELDLE